MIINFDQANMQPMALLSELVRYRQTQQAVILNGSTELTFSFRSE